MHTITALQSSHVELSALSKQLQLDQDLLTSHKYLASPANQSMNCHYFPFYALVERYIGCTVEYATKVDHFKQLLVDSLQRRHLSEHLSEHHDDLIPPQLSLDNEHELAADVKESDAVHHHHPHDDHECKRREDAIPHEYAAAMSSTPIECEDTYLPTIDEDRETVWSYHSHHLSAGNGLTWMDPMDSVDRDDRSNDSEEDRQSASSVRERESMDCEVVLREEAGAHTLQHQDYEFVYSDESGPEEVVEEMGHCVGRQSCDGVWGQRVECDALTLGLSLRGLTVETLESAECNQCMQSMNGVDGVNALFA